jgi:C-terminal processing protease CtpA/Prc
VTKILNDSLANIDNLKVGDVITKVNGESVLDLFEKNKKYIAGSNRVRKLSNAYFYIFNGNQDSVLVIIEENDVESIKVLHLHNRMIYKQKSKLEKWKLFESNIGYVHMGLLEQEDVANMMKEFKNTKGLILDLRRGQAQTTYKLISKYISTEKRNFFKMTTPDFNYPGKFIELEDEKSKGSCRLKYKGKVILVVNENTQSHGELTAMCLQNSDHVTTIGSQTSGADGKVRYLTLHDNYLSKFSGSGIFCPNGTITQRVGVKIDIVVKPTIKGIKAGKDEVLEAAIAFANQ